MIVTILLSLLNLGLLAIPIGGTAGVLAGIDYYRRNHGQSPLFTTPDNGGTGGGGSSGNGGGGNDSSDWTGDDPNATTTIGGVTISMYCQQYNEITVNTTGQNYTLNPNQWGLDADEDGGLCLNVTTNNNDTYATNTTAPLWSATWGYPMGPKDDPVHAYPNIMIAGEILPAKVGSLTELGIDVSWSYSLGSRIIDTSTNASSSNLTTRAVANVDFSANVAIDMFFDSNKTNSQSTSDASYEVMVWFAQFGPYTDPIGVSDGIIGYEIVQGVNFTLYNGTNDKDQHVLTWIAKQATISFSGSIMPLITALTSLGIGNAPTENDYIGYFSFGSEAYYTNSTDVTFNVTSLAMDIW